MRKTRIRWVPLVCGVLCALSVFAYMQSLEAKASAQMDDGCLHPEDVVEVCVAAQDIYPGQRITPDNCKLVEFQTSLLPEGALSSYEEFEYEGITTPVFKGQVISSKHFETALKRKITVPSGYVAVSVPAQDVAAVGAQIVAGNHVDVYSTSVNETVCLLEGVLVLDTSIEQAKSQDTAGYNSSLSWITLAVEPDLVKDLISISQKAELYFVISSERSSSEEEGGKIHESTNINLS